MTSDRRRFLRLGGLAAAGVLAGCSGGTGGDGTETDAAATTEAATATDAATAMATATDAETATAGETTDETDAETTEDAESDGGGEQAYDWVAATFDSYWYSLYNMSANISMSGNGVLFPHNEKQQRAFENRFPKMLRAANRERPPIENANLNMAAFTEADPHFTEEPVLGFDSPDQRPDASTLTWTEYSGVVSPSSLAWTHLKGVTWAKNFQNHADILPETLAPLFRAEVLTTLAQLGIRASLVAGGPEGNGALTKGDSLELVSEFRPSDGTVVDDTTRPNHHSAMLWFLSDLVSLSTGGWFGYEQPQPLIPAPKIQELADGMARTTMNAFEPAAIVEMGSTRDLGQMLGAVGWYGTHAGGEEMTGMAAEYANGLASAVEENLTGGMIENGADNQAATQGVVGQGLLWASQIEGVDHRSTAEEVLGYMATEQFDDEAGTFASGPDADTYTITARDAGDVTGGVNAAVNVLGMESLKEPYTRFFDQTFNRGRLQRAERPPSRSEDAEFTLPLPSAADGEFGQAAVYNAAVEYDTGADEWSVTDDRFHTAEALYLANQDIWISHWGGDFYQGSGAPGESDEPTNEVSVPTSGTATTSGTTTMDENATTGRDTAMGENATTSADSTDGN
jgi:hypothetical protein